MIFIWEGKMWDKEVDVVINTTLIGMTYEGKRADHVSFTRQELKWLANNPDYIHKVVGAMRDADPT